MTKLKTSVTRAVALATFLGGLGACAESTSGEGGPTNNTPNQDPVEAAIGELGVPIAGCDATTASGGNGFASNTLTLTVDTDALVLSAAGGVFTANGYKCTQTVSGAQKPLKITDVKQISIKGTAHDNKVILDFLPGTFGTGVLAASMGGITVDFATTTQAGDNDSVMLRASSLAEKYKFAAVPASGTVTDIYIEISGDHTADIDIKPSAGTGSKLALTASMGGGNDEVIANTAPSEFDKFGSVTSLVIGGLPAGYGVTAYGGPGDDKFTGGMGDDAFYGGDGNDTFMMNATTDGADIYSGDVGSDTVDYSGRSAPLKIDLGPARPAAVGGADLRAPGLYGTTGALAGKVLAVVIDGIRTEVTFGSTAQTAPAKPQDILDQINTPVNTALGTTGVVYASLTGKNQLQIMSNTNNGSTSFVKIDSDPAIAAGGTDAASAIGFATPGPITTLPAVGNVDITTASLYGSGGTLDTKQVVLLINGVYVRVVFAAPADDTALLAALNSAINAALGTTGVKYATEDASKFLNIAATKLDVKDATMAYSLPAASCAAALGFRSSIEGSVDVVGTAALFGGSGSLANASLGVVIDGARVDVAAGATPADITGIVSAINTGFNTEFGTTGKVYAFLSTTNHLVVNSNTDVGGVTSVRFLGDPAVAAAANGVTEAATTLGFTVGAPGGAKLVGGDISAMALYGGSGTLASARLTLVVNGVYVPVDITAPTMASDVTGAINTAVNTALGTTGVVYASQNAKTKKLELAATWISVRNGLNAYAYTSAATATLGFGYDNGVKRSVADPDDGLVNERDDVRYSTENINGGSGDDVIYGNDVKNTIKGNGGNDTISGGANGATCNATDGDALLGGDGNDTFILSAPNCKAVLTGNDGDNVADFSGRSAAVQLKNNGTADDGEGTMGAEGVNIGTDIHKMIGGFGADSLTGGASDDTLVGGPGADSLIGGTGFDTVDYSGSGAFVNVTACFTSAVTGCGTADDGSTGEMDQVYQIEHVIGSKYNDNLSVYMTTTTELMFEGGEGDDTITGSSANDTIYGDLGDDTLNGGAGDDTISGDAGDDALDGGDGDSDICLSDSSDVTTAKKNCEL